GQGINPTCRMLCLRRIDAKNGLMKRKIVESEERILHRKHQLNVAQVLYGKDEQEIEERLKGPRNFLDGYYIYYLNGLEGCQKHTENMKNEDLTNRTPWSQAKPEEYEIDLGEQLEKTKAETKRIIKRAFTPGLQLGKKYIESWSDGTQVAFFKRFYESAQRLDAVHMVRDNVKKVIEVWGNHDGNQEDDKKE
ncbi:10523_t:CDS:2, partial [Acaulospora morrowiae]